MSAAPSPALGSALIAAVVTATLGALIFTGDPALATLPLLLTVIAWALLTAPLHRIALAVFFVAILLDNPKEHPAEGRWTSPIAPLGVLLYENLNTITGVSSLRFSGADLLLLSLVALVVLRPPQRDAIPVPAALLRYLGVAFVGVVWLEAWGMARSGDFKASLWQMRQIFWAPLVAYIFCRSVRGPRDHRTLGEAVVGAAILKALLALYFYLIVCRPLGYRPAYATTHSDTVLFVTAIMVAVASAIERRTIAAIVTSLAIAIVVGLGIVVNGRRLAYVSLSGALAAIYLVLPQTGLRRMINRAVAAVSPAVLLYLAIGWRSSSAIFGPARKIASLFSKDDRSSAMRDIENYNLILTWKRNLLLGSGFGHEYDEVSRADNIREIFPLYRYVGHNSILWLESVGGFVGFTAIWLMLVAGVFFAARGYRFSRAPLDRAAALTAISVVVIFGAQAYGDMGITSWNAMFLLGMSLAVAAKLAVASGGFPAPGLPLLAPSPEG